MNWCRAEKHHQRINSRPKQALERTLVSNTADEKERGRPSPRHQAGRETRGSQRGDARKECRKNNTRNQYCGTNGKGTPPRCTEPSGRPRRGSKIMTADLVGPTPQVNHQRRPQACTVLMAACRSACESARMSKSSAESWQRAGRGQSPQGGHQEQRRGEWLPKCRRASQTRSGERTPPCATPVPQRKLASKCRVKSFLDVAECNKSVHVTAETQRVEDAQHHGIGVPTKPTLGNVQLSKVAGDKERIKRTNHVE